MTRSSIACLLSTLLLASALRADEFPTPYNSEPASSGQPMPPDQAAAAFRVPEGFHVNVFAAEPDVANPIAMAWDARGRMWIAENNTYAERPKRFEFALRDRIVILADRDGDGRSDERSVFADDLQMLTSVEVGRGGVWAMCPPELIFIPDRNGDDKPDGPAEVVLDGFDIPPENFHNFANGLRWGPDGWLYGRCGASAPGNVGLPGTPAAARTPLRGGMWRYHPERKAFETICHGTTNPWGHDWNEHGEAFFINTVNGHLWHMIAGAHFVRPHTIDPNPRAYEQIDMHADHWHWDTGKDWTDSRKATGEHDRLGGGHAHIGAMIYLADQWPKEYYGRLYTLNMHGRRANRERLDREGSGYVGRHEPDILFAGDTWFRGMELSYGPDGSVFLYDWSDAGECHDSTGVHRTSGRIYRVTYGEPKPSKSVDLTKAATTDLVELHKHRNEWFVRQARGVLADRAVAGQDSAEACAKLAKLFTEERDVIVRLRALWTLFALGGVDERLLTSLLAEPDEHLRAWGIRLLSDAWPLDTVLGPAKESAPPVDEAQLARLVSMAEKDDSGLVRLVLSSTVSRLPVPQRLALATALANRAEDADDHNLPPLVWYGLIPVADSDPQGLVKLAGMTKWPRIRKWVARRMAEDLAKRPNALDGLLQLATADGQSGALRDVVTGMTEGLAGWHKAPQPAPWAAVQAASAKADDTVRQQVRDLSILFGDGRALEEVRKLALDKDADVNQRRAALEALIEARPPDLREICEKLLGTRFVNTAALRGLSQFDDPAIGRKLAQSYKKFHHSERAAALETLCSRPTFAKALLDEMAKGGIARTDLSAFQVRQMRSFGDEALTKRLVEVWGELRDSPADKQRLIAQLKEQLTTAALASADPGQGRVVFDKTCGNCHRLYGRGGEIGPDLTGAGRQNLDYLLSNLVDPSAVVTADFRMSVVVLADGRVLNGIIRAQTDRTLTLQTAKEKLTIDRDDIEAVQASPLSLMPEGQMQTLTATQIRDLVAYLMTRSQVALPPGAEAAARADASK